MTYQQYQINNEKCVKCLECVEVCPNCAINQNSTTGELYVDSDCAACGQCADVCPVGAIAPRGEK